MRRGAVVAALMLMLSFMVGALSGMAAEEALGLDWFDFFEEHRNMDGDRLLAGLNLSAEQRVRAERILERQEDGLEEYWEARVPEIRRLMELPQLEIRAMLTPAQQEAFDDRVRRLDGRLPEELRED
jgi:Spy/CpxP family protein refolding chaperone